MPQIMPSWALMNQIKPYQTPPDSDVSNPLLATQQNIMDQNVEANRQIAGIVPKKAVVAQQAANNGVTNLAKNAQTNKTETEHAQTSEDGSNQKTALGQDAYNRMQSYLQNSPAYQQEQGHVDDLNNRLSMLMQAKPQAQVDLRPLAAFTNYETGGKFNSGSDFAPPKDAEKYQELLMKYGKEADEKQSALNLEPFKAFNTLYNGTVSQKDIDLLKNIASNGSMTGMNQHAPGGSGANGLLSAGAISKFAQGANADYQKGLNGLQSIDDALTNGSVGQFGTALFNAANYIDGASARSILAAFKSMMPATAGMDIAKLGTYLQTNPNAQVPPQLIQSVRDRLNDARSRLSQSTQEKIDVMRKSFNNTPRAPGVDPNIMLGPITDQVRSDFEKNKPKPTSTELLMQKMDDIISKGQK